MKKLIKGFTLFLAKVLFAFLLISILWVVIYKFVNPPISGMMLYKWITIEDYDYKYEWVNIEKVSPYVPLAFIAAEDQSFLTHNGFDIKAIEKAIQHNKESDRKRGASTISQQVAKNTFLFPTRSMFRKGVEAYFTLLIELIWSKQRIMEVYINIVELGEGTFGVSTASNRTWKVAAQDVSISQAALLATVLPNPIKYKLSSPSNYMIKRKDWVLRQMNNLGGKSLTQSWYE